MPALPSLSALRSFDAVARHLHFRRAAEELNVSHAAVSQQISQLEADLGVKLLNRGRGGASLTAQGRQLALGVNPAFELLRDTVAQLGPGRAAAAPRLLRVSLLPSLATSWLYARLPDWHARHPELHLELETSTRIVALGVDAQGPDAAIRYGAGDWPGMTAERLCGDWLIAVVSPAARARVGLLPQGLPAAAALFEQLPLLRHETGGSWMAWFKRAGMSPAKTRPGPLFRDAGVLLAACKAGQGIALMRRSLAADALLEGSLMQAHALVLTTDWANYLVYPASGPSPAVLKLRDWLRGQVQSAGFLRPPEPSD